MYKEIKPAVGLSQLVDTFWTFSAGQATDPFKVLPDTCTDLIVDLSHNMVFLSGAMTRYQLRELQANTDLMGVRFKTEHFGSLSSVPMAELSDLRVELSDILPNCGQELLNRLQDLDTIAGRVHLLGSTITRICHHNAQSEDAMALALAKRIRELRGKVRVGELAATHHISLRQLERRFKNQVGLTIKEFSTIVRFGQAKEAINTHNKISLLKIAFDLGYYDHAHMRYEFKRLSGESPGSFR